MHTIWIKVQKERINIYQDKVLISSCSTIRFVTEDADRAAIAQAVTTATLEAAESYDAES
jgi:hypothetical protein